MQRRNLLSHKAAFLLTTALGVGLLLIGVMLLLYQTSTPVHAQEDTTATAEYAGTKECLSCHRDLRRAHAESPHTLALQAVTEDANPILGDFTQGQDVRTILFPGEDAPRAFTADDIAYAIGVGRYVQAYLYQTGDNQYMILPAQWNVVKQAWESYKLADVWPDPAYDFGPNCAGCHTSGLNVQDYTWIDDGVQCESCHGPGSLHIEAADNASRRMTDEELAAIRSAIYLGMDAQVCGQCHSRGTAADGIHPYPIGYTPGLLLDDSVFKLFPPTDTVYWWEAGHAKQPNMQYNEWFNSTHAKLPDLHQSDYASDTCLQCHSADYRFTQELTAQQETGDREGPPPEPVTLATAQFGVTCTTCHNPHSEEDYPTMLVNEPYTLCTDCHTNGEQPDGIVHHPVKEMFEGTSLIESIPGIPATHFTAEDGPKCMTCHMQEVPIPTQEDTRVSHALTPLLPGESDGLEADCTKCHTQQIDNAGMQQLVSTVQNDVSTRLKAARAALKSDSPAWIKAALDFVEGDGSLGIHNYAYTDILLDNAEQGLGIGKTSPVIAFNSGIPTEEVAALPLMDVIILGLPLPVVGLLALGALLFLLALFIILATTMHRRGALGAVILVISVISFAGGILLIPRPGAAFIPTGNDGNCLVCHGQGERVFQLADDTTLKTHINLTGLMGSVHGKNNQIGEFGCLDCHGGEAFPHDGPLPADLRQYRIDMSAICIDCHSQQIAHYERVRNRDILVGCADCHTAHYVEPASQLEALVDQPGIPLPGRPTDNQ